MIRIVALIVVLFAISLMALGCGHSAPPSSQPAMQVAQRADVPVPAAGEAASPPVGRKIIYTSRIDVVVEDIAVARQKLDLLIGSVQKQGGFLAKQELTGSGGSHERGSWTIRVPLAQFDNFVSEVEKLGEPSRNSRDAQDVTDAYADLDSRLRNKQSSELRLLSHLEKSAQLKDTLELERELSRVRGEVEQLQGQLNLLKDKADLATVSVTMYERQQITPKTAPTFSATVSRTFDGSLNGLISSGQVLVLIVVALAPWAVVASVILIPFWIFRRKLKFTIPAQQ